MSPELLVAIAVVVGCVLTILILTLIILYAVRTERCCCGVDSNQKRNLDVERYTFLIISGKGRWFLT